MNSQLSREVSHMTTNHQFTPFRLIILSNKIKLRALLIQVNELVVEIEVHISQAPFLLPYSKCYYEGTYQFLLGLR